MPNYYEVLGVPRDASEELIRDRFRVLARESHPDRFTDQEKKRAAEVRFQLLTEAVNVLTNGPRRKAHDFELDKSKGQNGPDPAAIAKVYLAKGVKSYKENDFVTAVQMFDLSVQHNNKDAKALHYLAMACVKVPNQARKGIEAIEAALKMEPQNPFFLREAGKLYLQVGLKSKAERFFEEALKWNPDDTEVRRHITDLKGPSEQKNLFGSFFGRKG
ncbi:MAG: DnaJ domain-containing protein [Acidobacteria bacterium]|nr:DnaJ domain-containing protein [Acidobacteriota bacterium]MCG3193271.1 Chaperone protein DnaJ [Thermoanaerobaculia bacterium]MCK6684911.1 DnaJ domain-containing protein [Thermoanaerobaculia bacterium]